MGQIKLTNSLVMVALFTLAIVVFATNFGLDNGTSIVLSNDSDYASIDDSLIEDIQTANVNSNTSLNTLLSTTQDSGDQSASSGGQFKVSALTSLRTANRMVSIGYKKIFGEDSGFGIFLTALISMLGWMIGLYAWKAWRGNPD